jgi:hypothetical protein
MISREQHVQLCIEAAEFVLSAQGDVRSAFSAFSAGMAEHPETRGHLCLFGGMEMIYRGAIDTPEVLLRFLEGFADPQYAWTYPTTKGFGQVEMVAE